MDKLQVQTNSLIISLQWKLNNSDAIAGNVADWNQSKWEVKNMKSIDLSMDSMCSINALGPVIFSEPLSMKKSSDLCNQVAGEMFVVDTAEAKTKALQLSNSKGKCNEGK